ncbi:MAG: DUF5696 domain-containing protein [Defluviitaleaceae bacterium]|nr:DUF5696 domain-containing protein [Defluviitaleaceae bacterium]
MKRRLKKALPLICFFALVVVTVVGVILYNRGGRYYNFHYLWPSASNVQTTPLQIIDRADVAGMVAVYETAHLVLYVDIEGSGSFAVYDKRNAFVWHSNPLFAGDDALALAHEQNIMQSVLGFHYFNETRIPLTYWSHRDSAAFDQVVFLSIPGGVRMELTLGTTDLGIRGVPTTIYSDRLEERIMVHLDADDRIALRRHFSRLRQMPGFLRLNPSAINAPASRNEIIRMFAIAGYTLEDLIYDNELAGIETDISLDVFRMFIDFTLDGDTMTVNIPLSEINPEREENLLRGLELMRYFGAGGIDEEGYIFVPSGSGALIEFNNGKTAHEAFTGRVYGLDPMGARVVAQQTNPIRMPVFGIARDGAAVLANVINGSALTTIHADVSGRLSSFNTAWFNFNLRESDTITVNLLDENSNMRILQQQIYEGDITVQYIFLAGDDADVNGMASAYRRHLIDTNVLSPLTVAGDIPFYLSILGAVERREFIVGVPYNATVVMTTYNQAADIIERLNTSGISNIQMQWMGWFNRGANHDLATNVNPLRRLGSTAERDNLIALLEQGGGGFYPAVRFQSIRRDSRGLNTTREVAQDMQGFVGVFTTFSRELLSMRTTMFRSDVYLIIHPAVLPYHIDAFIPAFRRTGLGSIALEDLGDMVSQSLHRRNPIDRESARLIAAEQIRRMYDEMGPMMVVGGNDYSLFSASHLLDVPTQADRFLILDHSVPFMQMVLRGYVEYTGPAINAFDVIDNDLIFLHMLASGTAPHFLWTHEPMETMSFTQYMQLYSTHYEVWIEDAITMYRAFNEVFAGMRTAPITRFEIHGPNVSMTEFGGSLRVYVNTGLLPATIGDVTVAPMDFYVVRTGA